ncbi:MAG: hypothetical protein QOG03_249, partial [Actinomycetota bacterium]|nr:hypothetical protein [Actinomycetota bacterium]
MGVTETRGRGPLMAEEIVVRSPYDDAEVGRVRASTGADAKAAIAAAKAALAGDPLPQWRRAEILDAAASALAAQREDFARTIAAEAAKPIKTARVEADRAVSTFTFAAAECRVLAGEMVAMEASEVGEGKLGFVLRVPIGVVGGITPFNFPLNLVAHKVAPAIAAGCPIVVKPASQTPLSALKLRDLLVEQCGLPSPWFQVVPGPSGEVGTAIVTSDDIALITFTGSPPVGWSIREQAPKKRVGL